MIVRSVGEIVGSERDVHGGGWRSRRLLLASDGVPYSVHQTTVDAGAELRFTYVRHRETVYCIAGRGSMEDVARGTRTVLEPGTLYVAGIGDEHVVRTEVETTFLCIFDPPLEGDEEAE